MPPAPWGDGRRQHQVGPLCRPPLRPVQTTIGARLEPNAAGTESASPVGRHRGPRRAAFAAGSPPARSPDDGAAGRRRGCCRPWGIGHRPRPLLLGHQRADVEVRRHRGPLVHHTTEVLESHISYPMLAFFRSEHPDQSWITALGVLLDAATITALGVLLDAASITAVGVLLDAATPPPPQLPRRRQPAPYLVYRRGRMGLREMPAAARHRPPRPWPGTIPFRRCLPAHGHHRADPTRPRRRLGAHSSVPGDLCRGRCGP
jgi:hypothetical protein